MSLLIVLAQAQAQASERLIIGHFSAADLTAWQAKEFSGKTEYRITTDADLRRTFLQAYSDASASGLYREVSIDLTTTPILNWSWRVDKLPKSNDERSKQGDDFAARVYVLVAGGVFFWQTRSMVYVWSNEQPEGSSWHNPYTSQARHIVVQTGTEQLGEWVVEKRDVRADFAQLFGEQIEQIDAVAVMTDSDNSGQQASAGYGDIFFTTE